MYSTMLIKIFLDFPWGNAKMNRSMRGWLLAEGNLCFPSSFLLPIPFPSLCASSLLQHRSSRSENYLLYFTIYWQLYTLCPFLIYHSPAAARLHQAETFWLAGRPRPLGHTPACVDYQQMLGSIRPRFRMSGHCDEIQIYSGYGEKKKNSRA